tara:strand:+ start:177 stop:470 length:294 start_codon:yes stop_codon:yes gene_type:complete
MNLQSLLIYLRSKSAVDIERPSNCKDCTYDEDCFEYNNIVIDEGYYCGHNYQGNTGCCRKHTYNDIEPEITNESNTYQQEQIKKALINSINKKQNKK